RWGARSVLTKPIQTRDVLDAMFERLVDYVTVTRRELLLVDADEDRRAEVEELLEGGDVVVRPMGTIEEAYEALEKDPGDLVVVAADLPKAHAAEIVEQIVESLDLPEQPI